MRKGSKQGFSVVAKITGIEKLNRKLMALDKSVISYQTQAMQEATLLVHETAVGLLQANSSGTPVRRYNPKRIAVASKPGSPPNTDTGRLVQSIKFEFQQKGLLGLVGTNLKYGRDLEFGTKRMRRRPWLSVAFKMASKGAREIFRLAFEKSIKAVRK